MVAFHRYSGSNCKTGDPIYVKDKKGNPISHAIMRIESGEAFTVTKEGAIRLPLQLDPDLWVEVSALGYDTRLIKVKDLYAMATLKLQDKIGQLGEVVVAATRTDRSVENLPMPVTIIGNKQIQETGGMRLSEVLREQTGLQVIGDHGSGIQMQGPSSDYVLILLDGEPLIGRTAGNFDLDRISVSNIERIEVLRGPSSAIYGSEAMAGVINIITKTGQQKVSSNLEARYRSFNTWDMGG